MSSFLSSQRILLSGSSNSRTEALKVELAKTCSSFQAVNLDNRSSSDNSTEITSRIDGAFTAISGSADLVVVDARDHEHCGRDPIWEVPLTEWDKHHDAAQINQRRALSQIKAILQSQFKRSKDGNSIGPFSMIILGYKASFERSLDAVLSKIQRDIAWLHGDASVNFLDVENLGGDATDLSVISAMNILASSSSRGSVISLNDIWTLCNSQSDDTKPPSHNTNIPQSQTQPRISSPLRAKKPKVKIALSFDFDALSAFLGTGEHPDNNLADYSTGVFSGRVGGRRLLRILKKYQIADKVTWFIPGHTMETFESTVKEIVESGAEIGLHGYAHEGAYQMTPAQERDVLAKCMQVSERLTGRKVQGYRAPMYQLRETTIELLKEFGFLYDSSLSHHDSQPYFTPSDPPVERIDFSKPASSWLKPTPISDMDVVPPVSLHSPATGLPLVEIPIGWNNEDMMGLQYFPHVANTNGQVDVRVVEQRWKDIFLWLWENGEAESDDGTFIFPLLMHPDSSGLAHAMTMADRFIGWLRSWGDSVEFHTYESIAHDFLHKKGIKNGNISK
ncbi:hypothetical protein COCCADRAFT_24476 [Bipolaris zeicola 26-R-13]|uniref:NodB homology domain-containing protein n=1 Tax=Cochliobolus carbonum (strain 26-R-13) TaxID=930089 RepID=W6YDH9_COCC2|nr:uncharacterized protein COCCADRAFT_24476 [Bipolaris zeicola 26-R-13]EUC35665.1 hypothetical protein COCCADRAFT_24476 [Bipolaris zeicola 26-R-13]